MRLLFTSLIIFFSTLGICAQEGNDLHLVIDSIIISGNKKTQRPIILRELTFQKGDTIPLRELTDVFQKNKDNLHKTSLFNYVTITLANIHQHHGAIKIQLEERWYLWPELYFAHADRNLSNWIRSGDFSRIKYGIGLSHYNFRGRKEKLGFLFISGFVNRYAISYQNFYLDKAFKHSLSTEFYFDTPKKMVYDVENNKEEVLKTDEILISKKEAYLDYGFRPNLYITHNLRLGYLDYEVSDTIIGLNPDYLKDELSEAKFPTISYFFRYDKRNSSYYPTQGFHFLARAKHVGLNHKTINFWQFNQELSFYHQLFHLPLYVGSLNKAKLTSSDKRPLFMYDEIGYRDNLRGFEYYVVNGKYAFISFNSLKLKLYQTQIVELNYIPIPSINKVHLTPYLNLFFDAGYVGADALHNTRSPNFLVEKWLTTMGIGLDIVTYYDRVLSVYYSYNSLRENGFFISLTTGI